MEDDDEFGDLYTDVLSSFPSSSSSLAATSPALQPSPPAVPPPSRPIDLNLESEDTDDIPNSNYYHMKQQLDADDNDNEDSHPSYSNKRVDKSEENTGQEDFNNSAAAAGTRVLLTADVNDQQLVDVEVDVDAFQNQLDKDHNFAIEDLGPEPVIPASSSAAAAGDEWDSDSDSDSEDDLQIVLNDARHAPPPPNAMIVGSDDEDEDGDPLVILADDDDAAGVLQPVEDQDWGDEAGQSSQGKETTDASKLNANAGLPTAPKIGYSNYGYHPFHSQFKYIRPGAAPLPGGPSVGSGGALGQVRPPVSISTMAGRGRGDWRPPGMKGPPVQKGFHTGFWGSNVPGRGLEFTLPSHKTIFDVDIDSFEEKPWKYTGVDVSGFFNFGLNEESWKEYCKQLEQLRLESTMQSKIRVYESGRTEQEYDPDMPPELAAAAGIHDSAENVDMVKVDGGQGDLAKGSARVRPALPTGRAIQVETGNGERLPSVDTRPPRIRDSDAVIEDSIEDESAGNDGGEHPDSDSAREDDQVVVVDEDGPECGDGYFNGYPRGSDVIKEDDSRKKNPIINSNADIEEVARLSPQRAPSDQHPGSRDHASSENIGSPYEERWTKEKARQRSPHMSSGESALDRRSLDYQREDSIESMEGKHSPKSFSATPLEDAREGSLERKAAAVEDNTADIDSGKRKEDTNVIASSNTSKDKHSLSHTKQQKISSQVEPQENNELDEVGDFKASRSSDNSKATGSSRDHQKWREGVDEEVVQNGRSTYPGDVKRNHGEGGHDSRRKDREGRVEMEKNYNLAKGREEYYSHREWDPHAVNHFHARSESSDRRKERDLSEAGWQRRDEDPHGRRIRAEDARKQERADEMVSRRRSKAREVDRSDKDEYLHSRKVLDNGIWRGYHDKDVGFRYREKDDVSKSRHEILDDHHSKRRKDDEHARRDHVEKDDLLLSHRDSSSTRRKRERDGILSLRKREDQPRIRDNVDDHYLQRDRDEWYRAKQSYEETLSRREREDGRAPIRSSRNLEEKTWVGHSRGEEYKGHDKDTGRHGEQLKRRERVEDEPSLQHRGGEDVYARGNQFASEGKRSRQERSSARNNRAIDASESLRLHEKKHKENVKRTRESEGHSTSGSSKRYQGDKGLSNEMADMKGRSEQSMVEHDTSLQNLTGEVGGDVSSDDEQHDSKRGRSKLERWTSHKDRDYDLYSKSSSLKNKEISKNKNTGSGSSFGVHDEIAKKVEACDIEKLKRRSERFKLPLTSEKDPLAIKKMESEPLPSSQNDTPANAEVKHERPPRKRRWISS
uniref:Pre-mRNA polyadenylation factor Fip1 domain-containing protein n=1 Tax=Chenopodium quinoa TaxID=63459 RepID=A0A803NB41_CHEQI